MERKFRLALLGDKSDAVRSKPPSTQSSVRFEISDKRPHLSCSKPASAATQSPESSSPGTLEEQLLRKKRDAAAVALATLQGLNDYDGLLEMINGLNRKIARLDAEIEEIRNKPSSFDLEAYSKDFRTEAFARADRNKARRHAESQARRARGASEQLQPASRDASKLSEDAVVEKNEK